MNKTFICMLIAWCTCLTGMAQNHFEKYFEKKTLRIDFALSGNAQTQSAAIQQMREEPVWGGPVKNLIDTAMSLEGMPRNTSTHAAGVVITARPVCDYVPLSRNDDTIVTQYTMTTIEELGLLKMDFLGLRNLTVIRDAEELIRKHTPDFSIEKVRDDDPATFKMLTEGKTQGVFQLESQGMTGVCVGMKAGSIEDITAIVALYRPGPMDSIPKFIESKLNPRKVTYKCKELEPILKVTYGCIVYQEQVIEIFRQLGGYTMGQADNIRRAISKKKMKIIEAERKVFVYGDPEKNIPGCVGNGISEAVGQSLYDEIVAFANYAFNKAHAVCYAVVSYQTAYLKCHYPREYMAALMTSVLDSAVKVSGYIAECREMGIQTLPPDINRSGDVFTVEGPNIRFGMAAVKNIGRGLIRSVVAKRAEGGPFRSLEDFLTRMGEGELNKRAVENLIKCGAMDCFGNVPICTDARISTTNLPATSPRADVFKFVVEEFKAAIADLPSVKDVDASYYPRFTKESAQAALAFVYLNGEVYSGTAYWKEVVDLCDAIINTGAFGLEERVGDCFRADLEGKTKEVITAISVDKSKGVDGNQFILYAQHATDQQKYGLPFAPACGYCFDDTALNRYEEGDERLELLEYGPQFYLDGTPIMDPDHAGQQLVLTTIKDFIAAENNEGYRVLKYTPIGASFAGSDGNNDYIVERYSHVLLMKAEALVRLGQNLDTALDLVNQVRNRSELDDWTLSELTLENIERERANEFIWEGKRRPDMIRFGSYFNSTWSYKKTVTPEWRGIYPIPGQQISANPNLKQNPNYN
mgnify:CR=1 FL=1